MNRFLEFVNTVGLKGDYLLYIASSSAVAKYPEMALDAVRVGDFIYGFSEVENLPFYFYPVLTYKTKVVQIKNLPVVWNVGYGVKQVITRSTKIAALEISYLDGLMSSQINKTAFLVKGKKM